MIKLRGLSKVFRTDEVEATALNKVDFSAEQGEFVAVMGSSGCGKSSLLNIIGLLDNPSDGAYYFADKEVSKYKERQRTDLRKGTIVMVTHSPAHAERAHRIVQLFDGHVVTEEIRNWKMCQCANVPMCQYANVPMCQCSTRRKSPIDPKNHSQYLNHV